MRAQPLAGALVALILVGLVHPPPRLAQAQTDAAVATTATDDALAKGLARFKKGEWKAAAQWLEQATSNAELSSDVRLLLGICYYRLGRLERAEPLLRQALREGDAETQAAARVFLGLLFQEQGALDQARTELARVEGSPFLRDSAQKLLQQGRPHRLLFTLLLAPEYDGNVQLTPYDFDQPDRAAWIGDSQGSSDGNMLFVGSLRLRPLALGLFLGTTLSYRQQFRFTDYNLLLSSTWVGWNYLGQRNRLRSMASFGYAWLGGDTLYLSGDAKVAYQRLLLPKLALMLTGAARYRDYPKVPTRPSDFSALTGFTPSLQAELQYGPLPAPFAAAVGYQITREQTRAPEVADTPINDYRAWAHGPFLWLRARPHTRVELSLATTFLTRSFDNQRFDFTIYHDISLSVDLKSWLELFAATTLLWNDSSLPAFRYFKPTASIGLALHFGAL